MIIKKNDFKKNTSIIKRKRVEDFAWFNTFYYLGYNYYRNIFLNFIINKILLFLLILNFSNISLADDKMNLGEDVFINKAQCGVCHKLKATNSHGNIGPNLDQIKPSMKRTIYVVSNGIGVMQAWEGILTSEEIEAVAYYIFKSTKEN